MSIILALWCTSCITTKRMKNAALKTTYCDPAEGYAEDTSYTTLPIERIVKDSVLLKHYSRRDLLLANAIGIYPSLKKLDSLMKRGYRDTIEVFRTKQLITFKVLRFSTQVLSIASELDCEGERANQLSSYMTAKQQNKTLYLTIASITVSAASGIYTSMYNSNNNYTIEQQYIGIGGGVASAALGLMALFSSRKVVYSHKRNLLAAVWSQKDTSKTFPKAVWHVLTNKYFSNDQNNSMAYNLRTRWIESGYIDKNDEKIFFGPEGRYSTEELDIRANMLNQLQASVRTIDQQLESLLRSISVHYNE